MTVPSQTPRHERFEQLSREINDLIARYPAMPPGRPQSTVQSEIEKRFREIDALNAEQYAEEVQAASEAKKASSAISGLSPARKTNFPGVGIGITFILIGLISSVYLLILGGGIIAITCIGSPSRPSGPTSEPEPVLDPPQPAVERFQWRP